jgi:hypothetical protein
MIQQLKYVQPLAACPLRMAQVEAAVGEGGPALLCAGQRAALAMEWHCGGFKSKR